MRLIGMLDSPYVRRTALCLEAMGVAFVHEAVSVFRQFDRFRQINPVVKAPTLVTDDGAVLMDSTLILQQVEMERFGGMSPLWSVDPVRRLRQFRITSLAMAGCDKAVQLVYETNLRPAAAQHEPWKQRVLGQMRAAFGALEGLVTDSPASIANGLDHATITSAVVWQFALAGLGPLAGEADHPRLAALSRHCEALPLFRRYPPTGPGVPGLQDG